MTSEHINQFTAPTPEQMAATEQFNAALGALALAYDVDPDQLNESVGRYTEEIVSVLMDKPSDAA